MVPSAGTGSVRELLLWSTLSHAGLLFLVSRLCLSATPSDWVSESAIRLSFRGSSYLSSMGEKQILRTKPAWILHSSSRRSISSSLIVLKSGILFLPLSSSPLSILQALAIPADRICCAFWMLCTCYLCHKVSWFYLSSFYFPSFSSTGNLSPTSLDFSQQPQQGSGSFWMAL